MQGPPNIPDSHPYRIASTKCRIDKVVSPDDANIVARNMQTKEIDIIKKLCTNLALFTRLYKVARSTKHKSVRILLYDTIYLLTLKTLN